MGVFQVAAIGPNFGELGYSTNSLARRLRINARSRSSRARPNGLLGALDDRLAGRQWIMDDDFTIADIALFGWVRAPILYYDARELIGFDETASRAGLGSTVSLARQPCSAVRPFRRSRLKESCCDRFHR